jgi:hypothetical protein
MAKIGLETLVHRAPVAHDLVDLDAWPAPQGTQPELIPLMIDLSFGSEIIEVRNLQIRVHVKRASITLQLKDIEVVKGSRFGEQINEPFLVAEVVDSVQNLLAAERSSGINLQVKFEKGFFGELLALVSRKRTKKHEHKLENLIKVAKRIYRVFPIGRRKWQVIEPLSPNILSGRFLGEVAVGIGGERSAPLCFLELEAQTGVCVVQVSANPNDLYFECSNKTSGRSLSRAKQVVIDAVARRSVDRSRLLPGTMPIGVASDDICLGAVSLEVLKK